MGQLDVTPLQFTQDIAKQLEVAPLPKPVTSQVGEVVIPCPGTYVSVLSLSEVDMGRNCAAIPVGEISVSAAFDCANVANDDGTTNWEKQDEVSAWLDAAGDFLWTWAADIRTDLVYRGTSPLLSFVQLGAVAVASLTVQLPIP